MLGSGYQVLDPRGNGDREHGILDTIVGLKTLVFEQGDRPFSLTAEGMISLPTASECRGLGDGNVDLGLNFAATREWGLGALDVNLGYLFGEHFRGRRDDSDEWFVGTALRQMVGDTLEAFLEAAVEIPVGGGGVVRS